MDCLGVDVLEEEVLDWGGNSGVTARRVGVGGFHDCICMLFCFSVGLVILEMDSVAVDEVGVVSEEGAPDLLGLRLWLL